VVLQSERPVCGAQAQADIWGPLIERIGVKLDLVAPPFIGRASAAVIALQDKRLTMMMLIPKCISGPRIRRSVRGLRVRRRVRTSPRRSRPRPFWKKWMRRAWRAPSSCRPPGRVTGTTSCSRRRHRYPERFAVMAASRWKRREPAAFLPLTRTAGMRGLRFTFHTKSSRNS